MTDADGIIPRNLVGHHFPQAAGHSLDIHSSFTYSFKSPFFGVHPASDDLRHGTREGSTMNGSCPWRLLEHGSLGCDESSKLGFSFWHPGRVSGIICGYSDHIYIYIFKDVSILQCFFKSSQCWKVVGWVCRAMDGFLSTHGIVLFNIHGQKALCWQQQVKDAGHLMHAWTADFRELTMPDTGFRLKCVPQETKTCLNRSCTWSAGVNAKAKMIYMIDL